ncbi:DUF4129 domain-containing protein [Thermococcus sp. LS2]|uniref:DUF4129 domain-containing protein n=1 Tax=Thermococcus sp. LS2 TaxID=1638260 RepID=UPI001F116577|nr:DUF4129 domain-containing protein [Thermococcus sp. LS2]
MRNTRFYRKNPKHPKTVDIVRHTLVFLLIILLFSLLYRYTIRSEASSFNIEWIYLAWGFFFFIAMSIALRFLFETGISGERLPRKKSKWRNVAEFITLFALVVAVYLILTAKPRYLPRGEAPLIRYPKWIMSFGLNQTVMVYYKPLPLYMYVIPLLIAALIVLTAVKRRRKHAVVMGELHRFNPQMTFDTIEGTPEERIIKMYKNVVAGLVLKGYPYQKSWTHWEHEEKLRNIFEDLEDLHALTRIFEKAKYAKKLSGEDIDIAKKSYDNLMKFLR